MCYVWYGAIENLLDTDIDLQSNEYNSNIAVSTLHS